MCDYPAHRPPEDERAPLRFLRHQILGNRGANLIALNIGVGKHLPIDHMRLPKDPGVRRARPEVCSVAAPSKLDGRNPVPRWIGYAIRSRRPTHGYAQRRQDGRQLVPDHLAHLRRGLDLKIGVQPDLDRARFHIDCTRGHRTRQKKDNWTHGVAALRSVLIVQAGASVRYFTLEIQSKSAAFNKKRRPAVGGAPPENHSRSKLVKRSA